MHTYVTNRMGFVIPTGTICDTCRKEVDTAESITVKMKDIEHRDSHFCNAECLAKAISETKDN